MIKIFEGKSNSFKSNGKIMINPIELKEYKKKSLNGWYIEVEVNIKYVDYIVKDDLCVIKSKSKINPQAFRIGNPTKNATTVKFTAYHVMFDSQNYMLDDVRPVNKSALNALEYINERTNVESPFVYSSDITGINTAYFQLKSLYEAWSVIEERWGGTFDADNWNITLSNNLGNSVGEMLVYQKNLNDISILEDWNEVVTELFPVGQNGLKLPEKCLNSDIKYNIPYSKKVEFSSDIENYDEDGNSIDATESELIAELRSKATKYLNENKYPKVSYEMSTNISEKFDINDKIIVKHPLVNLITEVQEYTYDHKRKKTDNLVFGNYKKDVSQKIFSFKESVNKIASQVVKNNDLLNQQKDIIQTLNKLGHVYIDDNEILVLDVLPKDKAKYVLRIGLGGIAFSENGYDGSFTTAWTLDGSFNADFIKSGKINTSLIEGYDELVSKVDTVADLTKSISGISSVEIEDAFAGNLLKLAISGQMSLLYPEDNLFPEDTLYPLDSFLIIKNELNETQKIHLPINWLNYLNTNVYDEFILENNKAKIVRRVGINNNGMYALDKEVIEDVGDLTIQLSNGYNKIWLESFSDSNLNYLCKYAIKSDYTDVFATKVEMHSTISQVEDKINLEVSKKVNENEIVASINLSSEEACIKANKIKLEGIVTANNNFKVFEDGSIEAKNASLKGDIFLPSGGKVVGGDGMMSVMTINGCLWSNLFLGGEGFMPLGFDRYVDQYNNASAIPMNLMLDFVIPENFKPQKAFIYLRHIPSVNSDEYNNVSVTGSSKNIKAYICTDNSFSRKISFSGGLNELAGNYTEIANCFGYYGFTGSGSGVSEVKSIDILNLIRNPGTYSIALKSTYGVATDAQSIYGATGCVLAQLYIYGYTSENL